MPLYCRAVVVLRCWVGVRCWVVVRWVVMVVVVVVVRCRVGVRCRVVVVLAGRVGVVLRGRMVAWWGWIPAWGSRAPKWRPGIG
ncbi:hypothetical protein [Jidongwangia harbinensis]|uniref:hypothetical protein n=1 Tax=Jidongwangia harbinensis TaxID=2878561 RepID=UPI001CD9A47F|nr:hypothetical protein [Jidongwangia harbinensis]MCA2217875.1 hypothetical protein [Jidongwangia harbinensis]